MFNKITRLIVGDPNKREIEKSTELVNAINDLENDYESLSDADLRAKTDEFRDRLEQGETLDDLLVEAFAAVREASKRTIGLRHYDVQLIGGIALHQKRIAEMRTGEGKTLVATLPLYLNALTGRGVHLVTVNDYLARRDARWMAPIYQSLGLSVGVLQMAARTENGRNAFLIDLSKTSPHEDQHQLNTVLRAEAYQADITYGTNSEFGFDYLRDNLTMRLDDRVQRGHYYAIVDEVDNILIDEARTPLIISGPASDDTGWYAKMAIIVRQLNPEDYEVAEKDRTVTLTEVGEAHVEQLLEMPLRDPDRPEDVTPEQARLMGYLEQALRAQYLYRRNKDYLVQGGKVVIVDEFTGRLMPGRRWSDGLHQAVEAKENVKVEPENVTYATITLQNYFRMYEKLAGMTGTALTEAEEFYKIYKLDVLPIPTNLEYQAARQGAALAEIDSKDDEGYRYTYYARREDALKAPVFWKRQDYPDVVYRTQEAKLRSITQEILHYFIKGRPQLVGTTSVEHSERLSARLRAEPVRRLMQVFLVRHAWLEKNNMLESERAVPELAPLYKPLDEVDVALLRQMARQLDLSMNPEDPANLARLQTILDLDASDQDRLVSVLQGGVPHQVLNARKHDEESQIIARAGAFGAVTIATNMAGRGVDIKLGGELPEEILGDANRALVKAGFANAYEMTNTERREALRTVNLADVGIFEEGARAFLAYMDDMERVRALGGLHVIGSERHEARRIDNQLRGRAARQGDPGSSRFYLALDDELMRLFGGGSVEGLLARLNVDEALPIESNMVGKLVEQSQTRVEGANFDVRKHLLEYDDVLNTQRARIYAQRDAAFTKEDLSGDIDEMLEAEIERRVTESGGSEEGPWKLLAYLEEIQPAMEFEELSYPSYTQRLLMGDLRQRISAAHDPHNAVLDGLLEIADQTLQAEQEHLMRTARELLERSDDTLQEQISERLDALDTALEGLGDTGDDEGEIPHRPQELLEELTAAVRLPVRLNPEQLRQLAADPASQRETIASQVEASLTGLMTTRLVGSFERRLEESLNLSPAQLQEYSWKETLDLLLSTVEEIFTRRRERLLGSQSQISKDISPLLPPPGEEPDDRSLIRLLSAMARGTRMVFDRKTHRQAWQNVTRLHYGFLTARLLQDRRPADITADVLEHLQGARQQLVTIWGRSEWIRLLQNEVTLSRLTPALQEKVTTALGEDRLAELAETPLMEVDSESKEILVELLGQRMLNEISRQLVLSVISELWVDYLTRVEALRVSIGLEAYAQRDPLVQYKSQATEMFQTLIADVRMAVISRLFTYRPRQAVAAAAAPALAQAGASAASSQPVPEAPSAVQQAAQPGGPARTGGKKKRKRH